MKPINCIYLFVLLLFTGCATQRTSTIVSCDYDDKRNHTNYMVFPYGTVSIPGKWDRSSYNAVSKQQFFKNEEGITIAIAFGPCNKYEFNADNSKKEFDFVEAFYEWESQYFTGTFGLTRELIEKNETGNFVIWRIYGDYGNSHWDTYFLLGEKSGIAKNYSIMGTSKWTATQKVNFLKAMNLPEN